MSKCIAILGANGVGKSTLADRLCGVEGSPTAPAAPHEIRIAPFSFLAEAWTLLDCPGSLEFLQASMDALLACDMAVICVSPDPDHAVLSAPYLRLAEQAGLPVTLFINRMDTATHRARDIVSALQGYSKHPVVLRQIPMRKDGAITGAVDLVSERAWAYAQGGPSKLVEIPSALVERESEARGDFLESLSEYDDWLLEELIEDRVPAHENVYDICARVVRESSVVPAFIGAAGPGNGVFRLMKALRHETPDVSALADRLGGAQAVSFQARHRRHVGKTVWLRALEPVGTGALLAGQPLGPVTALRVNTVGTSAKAQAGEVFTAIKSDHIGPGSLLANTQLPTPDWHTGLAPQMRTAVVPTNERDDAKLSLALAKLADEDLSLDAGHDPETGAHTLSGQGLLHLRHAREVLAAHFGVATEERPLAPALRETISRAADTRYRHKKQSGGAGQFADVKLSITPQPRGQGFDFNEQIHGGSVPRNYIPAVEVGARDAMERGPLGFPVVDIAVTLTDGQHHNVDSSDMAFRIAGRGAVRAAMNDAGPVLLEPVYKVRFLLPSVYTGALNPLVASRRGQVLGFDRLADAEGWDQLDALLPGSALNDLSADLRSVTQGVGRFETAFDHYQELYGRDAAQMIEQRSAALEIA